jgi:hypothetical protein
MRRPPTFTLEEHTGDRYSDLAEAQRAALPELAMGLAATIRAMLAVGVLTVENGRIIPTQKREEEKQAA